MSNERKALIALCNRAGVKPLGLYADGPDGIAYLEPRDTGTLYVALSDIPKLLSAEPSPDADYAQLKALYDELVQATNASLEVRAKLAGFRLVPDGGQTDCTPAREAKWKCVCGSKWAHCKQEFGAPSDPSKDYCLNRAHGGLNCGHPRACHALGNTAVDGKEEGR